MSDYFKSLDKVAQTRYVQKLALLNLKEEDDPYLPSNGCKFVDDMSLWPPVEYAHMFCYYVERPGLYTKKELMQWKSLDAYNYFKSGHVQEVKIWKVDETCSILKATVNPSQKSTDKAHRAWAAVKSTGDIIVCHCTCMAGLGEGCSHSAAVLFKIETAVKNGYTAGTSSLCTWNQVFSNKHEPAEIVDIDFKRPSTSSRKSIQPAKRKRINEPSEELQSQFIQQLQETYPESAILTAFIPVRPTTTGSSLDQRIRSLPYMLASYYDPKYSTYTQEELIEESRELFEHRVRMTKDESDYLADSTKLQCKSSQWWEHKRGCLTSSKFLAICRTSISNPAKSLVSRILSTCKSTTISKVPSLSWGIENEDKARNSYKSLVGYKHTNFQVSCTGLHVNINWPHLGASPDGLVTCSCCGAGVLEIKCPYSVRQGLPTEASYLISKDGASTLSESHDYYYQIQGQLGILERSYCDFVVWTPKATFIERIMFNHDFFINMKKHLDDFFVNVIFPKLLQGQIDHHEKANSSNEDIFCYCRKKEFGKMILCDNPNCRYGWFHFPCVNLTTEPIGSWFCDDCYHA